MEKYTYITFVVDGKTYRKRWSIDQYGIDLALEESRKFNKIKNGGIMETSSGVFSIKNLSKMIKEQKEFLGGDCTAKKWKMALDSIPSIRNAFLKRTSRSF